MDLKGSGSGRRETSHEEADKTEAVPDPEPARLYSSVLCLL